MSEPINPYHFYGLSRSQGDDGKRNVQIPDKQNSGFLPVFIPPPNFVNFDGPTTQKTVGMVRGVPGPFTRHVEFIGSYHIAHLEYAIQHVRPEICETERYIRIAMAPDGYGGFCLLFQCMETIDPSVWMCLKPER